MQEKKQKIRVSAELENIEKAKELLADLEVLNEKYDIEFDISRISFLIQEAFESFRGTV